MNYIECLIYWTFALLGLFQIIKSVIDGYLNSGNNDRYMVIIVKNGEEYIEGVIRLAICRKYNEFKQILVIDLNSSDKTKEIVNKIGYDREYIKLIEMKQ